LSTAPCRRCGSGCAHPVNEAGATSVGRWAVRPVGFSAVDEPGLYATIFRRRDVRGQFSTEPLDEAILAKVLAAAHAAPSVGLSQPWDFVVVRDRATRGRFRAHVLEQRQAFADSLPEDRAERFAGIKIEGILEAACGVVVTYDPARGAPSVLGRNTIADAGLYSVCLAIENLWLAATAEGLGVGWVSFYEEAWLAELLGIPSDIRPVAWLCIGPVTHLEDTPDLERAGWRNRLDLGAVCHQERWGHRDPDWVKYRFPPRWTSSRP
jgi:5,6-dimethylbenzimidazole synthase